MTATPLAASLRIRSTTTSVWVTPSAAVGSSMITSRASAITARATATPWRWPPESEPTGWRIERTEVTERPARVSRALRSIGDSLRMPKRPSSSPRNMFATMSRLSQSARSW